MTVINRLTVRDRIDDGTENDIQKEKNREINRQIHTVRPSPSWKGGRG